jgi:hypothetical protein
MSLHLSRQNRRRFVPRVEGLEARNLLSCSATFAGGTILIQGTKKNDSIVIEDEGNLDPASPGSPKVIRVTCDGVLKLTQVADTVNAITVNTSNGRDNVQYRLLGSISAGGGPGSPANVSSTRAITVNLGQQRDTFNATLGGNLQSANFALNVFGGQARDAISVDVNGDLFGTAKLALTLDGGQERDNLRVTANSAAVSGSTTPGVDVGVGTEFTMDLSGRQGRDNIAVQYSGELDGNLRLSANGGSDRDTINAALALTPGSGFLVNPGDPMFPLGIPTLTPATLNAQLFGRKGRDKLTLGVNRQNPLGNLTTSASIDGGPDRDTCSTDGSNVPVTTTSCP